MRSRRRGSPRLRRRVATSPTQGGNGGLYSSAVKGAPRLKPERTAETEVGIDFGLFNQKVDGSVTYYDAKTTDVIFSLPVPVSTGYQNVTSNGGEITNKGLEVVAQLARPRRPRPAVGDRHQLGAESRTSSTELAGRRLRRHHRRVRRRDGRQGRAVRHLLRHRLGPLPLRGGGRRQPHDECGGRGRDVNALCRSSQGCRTTRYSSTRMASRSSTTANRVLGNPEPEVDRRTFGTTSRSSSGSRSPRSWT